MTESYSRKVTLSASPLLKNLKATGRPLSLTLELTARCNCDCRHCYLNLPAGDPKAAEEELDLRQIEEITDQAFDMGVVWCLLTGGEPLLRSDFPGIYLALKRKGFLVSIFTNACLIDKEHIELFKRYPPRDIEITVYGVTAETYERVTGKAGSFAAFMRGLELLLSNDIKPRLKTVALRSNYAELAQISAFCRQHTRDYFRFDPFLHLRSDRREQRNSGIKQERLTAAEIADLEAAFPERMQALEHRCAPGAQNKRTAGRHDKVFICNAGTNSFYVTYDGYFRLCEALCRPEFTYNLKSGSLAEALTHARKVRDTMSAGQEFADSCLRCDVAPLCMGCPAYCDLETGSLASPVPYFCEVARARHKILKKP